MNSNGATREDGNLDAGDFVLDALGERWAVELCHADYLSPEYFSGESQSSPRWLYYQTETAGQNTILYDGSNQLVSYTPDVHVSGDDDGDAISWVANLTSAYGGPSVQRNLNMINERRRVLIQDEIRNATKKSQWRMHTRAEVSIAAGGRTARESACSGKGSNPQQAD